MPFETIRPRMVPPLAKVAPTTWPPDWSKNPPPLFTVTLLATAPDEAKILLPLTMVVSLATPPESIWRLPAAEKPVTVAPDCTSRLIFSTPLSMVMPLKVVAPVELKVSEPPDESTRPKIDPPLLTTVPLTFTLGSNRIRLAPLPMMLLLATPPAKTSISATAPDPLATVPIATPPESTKSVPTSLTCVLDATPPDRISAIPPELTTTLLA